MPHISLMTVDRQLKLLKMIDLINSVCKITFWSRSNPYFLRYAHIW